MIVVKIEGLFPCKIFSSYLDFAVNFVSFQELNLSHVYKEIWHKKQNVCRVKTFWVLQYPLHVYEVLPPVLALGPVVWVEDAHLPDLLVEGEGGLVMGLYQGGHSIVIEQK